VVGYILEFRSSGLSERGIMLLEIILDVARKSRCRKYCICFGKAQSLRRMLENFQNESAEVSWTDYGESISLIFVEFQNAETRMSLQIKDFSIVSYKGSYSKPASTPPPV